MLTDNLKSLAITVTTVNNWVGIRVLAIIIASIMSIATTIVDDDISC